MELVIKLIPMLCIILHSLNNVYSVLPLMGYFINYSPKNDQTKNLASKCSSTVLSPTVCVLTHMLVIVSQAL